MTHEPPPAAGDERDALEGQRDYWDGNLDTKNLSRGDAAEALPDLEEEIGFLASAEYRYARERLGDVAGRRVWDIGCGLGVASLALARDGATVVAMDLSGARLRALRRWAEAEGLADRLLLVQGAVEAAPLRGGAVDRAVTKSVLIHTEIEAAGAEIARALAPGGRGVFIEPARHNPLVNLYRRFFGPAEWRAIAFYFDADRWARFERPFDRTDRQGFFLLGFVAFAWQYAWRNLDRFRGWERAGEAIDAAIFRLCPPLRGLRWMDVTVVETAAAPPEGAPAKDPDREFQEQATAPNC